MGTVNTCNPCFEWQIKLKMHYIYFSFRKKKSAKEDKRVDFTVKTTGNRAEASK